MSQMTDGAESWGNQESDEEKRKRGLWRENEAFWDSCLIAAIQYSGTVLIGLYFFFQKRPEV